MGFTARLLLRCAQGFLWIASNARSGSIPRPPAGGVVWEEGEAFSLWIWVRWEVSGFFVGVCAVVLAMGWDAVGGSAGSVLRSQGSSGGGSAFARIRAVNPMVPTPV